MRSATIAIITSCFAVFSFGTMGSKECATCSSNAGHFPKTKKVMGYYPSYNSEVQSPKQLNYTLYTDVLFFVAVPELNYTFSYGDMKADVAEDLARTFVEEAGKHGVNAIVSIGGWTGSLHFSKLTSTDAARKKFANAIVTYAKGLGFGGVDIDWEYPNAEGIGCNSKSPQDTVNFGMLLNDIRDLWSEAQITVAISINGLIGADGSPATLQETALIVKNVDFANLMAYDVFGAWVPFTGPIAPLSARCAPKGYEQSVETGIDILVKQGFPHEKIILGIPAYAKRLQLRSPELQVTVTRGRPSYIYQNHTEETPRGGQTDDEPGKDVCGSDTTWGGAWLVNELITKGWLSKDQTRGAGGYRRHWDKCSATPFLTNGKYFIVYDDQFSTIAKAEVAKERELAGIYFFDTTGAPDVTIQAARQAL